MDDIEIGVIFFILDELGVRKHSPKVLYFEKGIVFSISKAAVVGKDNVELGFDFVVFGIKFLWFYHLKKSNCINITNDF